MVGRVAVSVPSWSHGATWGDSAGFFLAHIRPAATGTVRPSKKCTAGLECTVRAIPRRKQRRPAAAATQQKKKKVFYGPGQVAGDRSTARDDEVTARRMRMGPRSTDHGCAFTCQSRALEPRPRGLGQDTGRARAPVCVAG